jgi:hypothetical protein
MQREQHTIREFVELWFSCAWLELSHLYSELHASYGLFSVFIGLCMPDERRDMVSNSWNGIVVHIPRDTDPSTLRVATIISETLLQKTHLAAN